MEVEGGQGAWGLELGQEPQVEQAQRLQREETTTLEWRRSLGNRAGEEVKGETSKVPWRGVKCYSLLNLAVNRFPGWGPWEAAHIRQQGTGGAGLMDGAVASQQ